MASVNNKNKYFICVNSILFLLVILPFTTLLNDFDIAVLLLVTSDGDNP